MNRKAEELTGYSRMDIHSRRDWFSGLFGSRAEQFLKNYKKDRISGFNRPRTLITENGHSEKFIEMSVFHDKDFEIWILADVTLKYTYQQELLEAKEQAEESDQLKSAFLANMSHEIRTPMNGILGFSQLLQSSDISEEEHREFLGYIESSGKRLLAIINDILDLSKIESGQLNISTTEFSVLPVLEEVIALFQTQIQEKGDQLTVCTEIDFSGDDDLIVTDRDRLLQILINLFSNALKFTDHGEVKLGFQFDSGQETMHFFVQDTGIGITEEQQKQIFERFYQVETRFSRKHEGSGLGLSIVKGMAELLGGSISLKSGRNQGSLFTLALPVQKTIRSHKKKRTSHHPDTKKKFSGRGRKILIVEDDETCFIYLKKVLNRINVEVLHSIYGSDSVMKCLTDPGIDLVLMDIRLPDMDGWEATRSIKMERPDLPIIAQTAYAMKEDYLRSQEAGCDAILTKPVDQKELLQLLTLYL